MAFNKDIRHRQSIRLRGFDYTQPGAYFITVCTYGRVAMFGNIADGVMVMNAAGMMVDAVWRALPQYYSGVALGEHVVMPNHFHGIVHIVGAGPRACPDKNERACPDGQGQPQSGQPRGVAPTDSVGGVGSGQPQGVAPTISLGDIVHRFKSFTTRQYADGVANHAWPAFHGRLWQRNYYEHIIRNEQSHSAISDYIRQNPAHWQDDVYCVPGPQPRSPCT